MAEFKIKKGFNIALKGQPSRELIEHTDSTSVAVYPLEFTGFKQRLKVKEGDVVKRGSELMENKRNEKFKICAPAGGKVTSVVRGDRRFVERIVIAVDANEQAEEFKSYTPEEIKGLGRDDILDQLTATGYLAFIKQRPFDGIADASVTPKSIFVNAMNTAPFLADAAVAVKDNKEAFQAGLELMARLTEGMVNLCVRSGAEEDFRGFSGVDLHAFSGPHPAGNTSVHISKVDPMVPTDTVWTVQAVDLVQIGRLFIDGELPQTKIISLGGPCIKEEGRKHLKVRVGSEIAGLLKKYACDCEERTVQGSILSGIKTEENGFLRFYSSSLTVLPEGRKRRFLGWTMPGFTLYSFTRLVASTWLGGRKKKWALNTNRNGGERALVLTGHYDKVMPLNIMVDYLIRAVLANDTDEAIKLGILETVPEDFALCDFICPCKTEVQDIIRKGLAMIEEEGI